MKIALTFVLSLTLAPMLGAQQRDVVQTTLTRILSAPDAYRGVWVRFPAHFSSLGQVSNPFFTLFEPSKFANFYVWADEQPIWRKDEYENMFGFLFCNKQNEVCSQMYKLKLYDRIEVVATVRNVFQGKPWMEVTEVFLMDQRLNSTTLSHIYRGESYMEKRDWKRAIAELSMAPGDDVPNNVRAQIHKDLALSYLRLGEAADAIQHLERAVAMMEGLDPEIRRLAALAKVEPETFLDRTLSNTRVEEHRRPMWEAFEGDGTGEGETETPTPNKAK